MNNVIGLVGIALVAFGLLALFTIEELDGLAGVLMLVSGIVCIAVAAKRGAPLRRD